jgi:hypothetical protein
MPLYGLHTRSNGNYPRLIEDRELAFEWDELVELTGISTETFESDIIPSGTKVQILKELQSYKTTSNDMHLMEAVDLTFPFVEEGDEVAVESLPSPLTIALSAFAQEFPMRDLRDYDISEIVTLAVEALHDSATVDTVANGIKLFKWIGLPNYNPEQMVKLITLSVQRNLGTGTLDNLMRTPEYCKDEHRREMVRANFGDSAAERFIDFCDSDVDAKLEDISLANYNLAHILGVDEFDFDEFVINQMATQISTEQPVEVTEEVVNDIVENTAEEANSTEPTDNIISETAKSKGKSVAFSGEKPVSKALAWSVLGASAIVLGLLTNKLRKL